MEKFKIYLTILLSLTLIGLKAQKMEPMSSMSMKDNGNASSETINPEFQKQLGTVVKTAGDLSDAFATDDVTKVDDAAAKVQESLMETNMHLLSGQDHMTWMKLKNSMDEQLKGIRASHHIEGQRTAYSDFNSALHESVKNFGIQETNSWYKFCPMALDGKGAYWFSNAKEIKNPYLGSKMLTCGSIRETYQ